MPYTTDNKALNSPFLDRRTKLLPCQKEMVLHWYKAGTSIRALAKMFKVDRRLIQFMIFPERKQKNLEDRQARGGWEQYYNREEHTAAIREHRRYKYKTLK